MKLAVRVAAAAVAAGAVTVTAACGSSGSSASAHGTIEIGVVLDQTGPFAAAGLPDLNGIRLAVDQANADGGVNGKKIQLAVQDGQSDTSVTAAAARTLSTTASVVMGTSTGSGCRAMQPILDRAKVLQYCLSPQAFNVTPLFFWDLAPVTDYVPATQPWLASLGVHKIGFIGQNDASGDGYLSVYSYLAKKYPGQFQIVAQQRFNSGATNVETQMTHLRDAHPDLIVAGTSGGNIVPVVQAAEALGMSQPIWVGTGSATLDALQPLANHLPAGGLFTNAFWVDVAGEVPSSVPYADKVQAFAAAYSKKYGQSPGDAAAGAYDATEQVIAALKSGATTGPDLAKYIQDTSFTGVLGSYKFSAEQHQGASMVPAMMKYTGSGGFKLAFPG